MSSELTKTIHGDSEMLSWTDGNGDFNALIRPKMPTAKDINDALATMAKDNPDVVVGSFKGVVFHV